MRLYDARMPARCGLLLLLLLCGWTGAAEAKAARCFTTDDGPFLCQFRATDPDGSFTIWAKGRPTYILNMIEPGVANGFVGLNGRNVALPGRYQRSATEPGCWLNDATPTKICAW